MTGTSTLIAEGNQVKLDTTLSNVSIQPLMKDLLNRDLLEGKGNVKLDVSTSGATLGAMTAHLDGTGAVNLRDGAIKGINLAATLRNAKTLLLTGAKEATTQANNAEKTDFSELNATFKIKDGVAVNEDLDLKSPLLRVGGSGKVDIGKSSMDYETRVSVVGTLKGQDGRPLDQLRGATIPVKVSGPLDHLAYSIDWNAAAEEALKAQAAQKLAPNVAAGKEKGRDALEQKARDALKGLLQK